jgi:hypothetical protein
MGSMLGRRNWNSEGDRSPIEMYSHMRSMALGAAKSGVIPRLGDHPDVFGVVVDIPAQGGYASVVALGDNTTSMYTSTGGGIIGAGEHPVVATATQRLLSAVQAHLTFFSQDDDGSLPRQGEVRLHVLTEDSLRRSDLPEDAFWGNAPNPLMPVIAAVQDVVSKMRGATPN